MMSNFICHIITNNISNDQVDHHIHPNVWESQLVIMTQKAKKSIILTYTTIATIPQNHLKVHKFSKVHQQDEITGQYIRLSEADDTVYLKQMKQKQMTKFLLDVKIISYKVRSCQRASKRYENIVRLDTKSIIPPLRGVFPDMKCAHKGIRESESQEKHSWFPGFPFQRKGASSHCTKQQRHLPAWILSPMTTRNKNLKYPQEKSNKCWHTQDTCENTSLPGKKKRKLLLLLGEEKEYVLGVDLQLRLGQNAQEDLPPMMQGQDCLGRKLNKNNRKKGEKINKQSIQEL